MPSQTDDRYAAWILDQQQKSVFFHQKLHEWGVLEVAYQIEEIQGELLDWNLDALNISGAAWNKVIHRGIKPVRVFAHPNVLTGIDRSLGYYRMMAMVSQKSMRQIRLVVDGYEQGRPLTDQDRALAFAQHLNGLISQLVDADRQVDPREFDLWRAMAAGSQAQGSWQNTKGEGTERVVKGLVRHRLAEGGFIANESTEETEFVLIDGRKISFADEPDIGVYDASGRILAAVEIKGGIDKAGILERVGAAMKSLQRAREENPDAVTILILPRVSVTEQAMNDLETSRDTILHWFYLENILNNEKDRSEFFGLLSV